MKKTIISTLLLGIISVGLLSGCGGDSNTTSAETAQASVDETAAVTESAEGLNEAKVLKVGYQPKFGEPLLAIEEEKNYLKDDLEKIGVSLEFYEFENGPAVLEAMSAGGIDVAYPMGDVPFVTSAAAGNPIIGLSPAASDDTKNTLAILVDDKSGIQSVEELKGKKVAANIGTAGHLFLVQALVNAGLTVDDIELINLVDAEYLAAFEGDSIDAAVTQVSMASTIASTGAASPLDIEIIELGKSVITGNKEFAEKNPELVTVFIASVIKDYDYFKEDPANVQQLTATRFDIPVESLAAYLDYSFVTEFDDNFYQRLQNTIDFLVSQDLIESIDAKEITTSKYIDEAKKYIGE